MPTASAVQTAALYFIAIDRFLLVELDGEYTQLRETLLRDAYSKDLY
jgi:hypothetical protein